jgi:hypothetical protein
MSKTLPKARLEKERSSFAVLDPSTELFYRKLSHKRWFQDLLRPHIAISYVWADWKQNPGDEFPDWAIIRERLLCILGPTASAAMRMETGNAKCCWLDSRCIDQKSASSKAYWIPRMDEIYANAKCTVLLLRDSNLFPLLHLAQSMSCNVRHNVTMLHLRHDCLLTQSCTTLPVSSTEQENVYLHALRRLYDGVWRKRAWIFQEILVSGTFLLSLHDGDFIPLSEIGVMANLLLQRRPTEVWLAHFSDWCRRLLYLRNFYRMSRFDSLSEANVLQIAVGLEATVPADKIYALCGILNLKNIVYNANHSADEAFYVMVEELVHRGRLAWMYAIPPPLRGESFSLHQARRTPFVLTRLNYSLVQNENTMHVCKASVGFPVECIGSITQTKLLAHILKEASSWVKEKGSHNFPSELQHFFFVPKIIRRIALDLVNPLLIDPLFGQLCKGLGISSRAQSKPTLVWQMIFALYTRDIPSPSSVQSNGIDPESQLALILVNSAAQSLQERLKKVQHEFLIVWKSEDKKSLGEILGLACQAGDRICAVKGDKQFLLAASFGSSSLSGSTDADFRGMIYSLDTFTTIQWLVKVLFLDVVISPVDMHYPLLGSHPMSDGVKDCRYDEYIKTDPSIQPTLFSLFKTSWRQEGESTYLNFRCKP